MIKNKDSLKAKAKNLAKKYNIDSSYILQTYMFEALLKRISVSKYSDNLIIKGGFLLSSLFGVDYRTTLDLDTTLKGVPLEKESIEKILNEIINIDVGDNIKMSIFSIKDIRVEEKYPRFSVHINADFEGVKKHLLIDITTGDVITYREIKFSYKTIFDESVINIMTYNMETIIAEKFEAVLSKNIENTRMKDYYDLYVFSTLKWNVVDKVLLKKAIYNTCNKRNSINYLNNSAEYISLVANDSKIKGLWERYQNNYSYAKNITFEDTIDAINKINDLLLESE